MCGLPCLCHPGSNRVLGQAGLSRPGAPEQGVPVGWDVGQLDWSLHPSSDEGAEVTSDLLNIFAQVPLKAELGFRDFAFGRDSGIQEQGIG